jgi:hypothetical protein
MVARTNKYLKSKKRIVNGVKSRKHIGGVRTFNNKKDNNKIVKRKVHNFILHNLRKFNRLYIMKLNELIKNDNKENNVKAEKAEKAKKLKSHIENVSKKLIENFYVILSSLPILQQLAKIIIDILELDKKELSSEEYNFIKYIAEDAKEGNSKNTEYVEKFNNFINNFLPQLRESRKPLKIILVPTKPFKYFDLDMHITNIRKANTLQRIREKKKEKKLENELKNELENELKKLQNEINSKSGANPGRDNEEEKSLEELNAFDNQGFTKEQTQELVNSVEQAALAINNLPENYAQATNA